MNTRRINGELFERLAYNGLANLRRMEETLNSLNVFPVADGDTGTNMRLTLENGLRHATSNTHLGTYLDTFNEGLLLGARGNSGVILSQIFRGIRDHLAADESATVEAMREAFVRGYQTAYGAVVQPVEGTILTVAREGAEHLHNCVGGEASMETLFDGYVAEMKESLSHTPEMLEVLKTSGVVDSGALGYITVIEGMNRYLHGEVIESGAPISSDTFATGGQQVSFDAFDENSAFKEGYCMEFILQLMTAPSYAQDFDLTPFIEAIQPFGNSLAATRDKTRVKVHIHTKEPASVITIAQRYGEFLTFKLENMQLQHNEQLEKKQVVRARSAERKPLAIVAVADGDGITTELEMLGCDCVLDGGPTMNTPSSAFVEAFAAVNAEHIVVLPNSKNVIGAAEQAAALSGRENIHVLPTKSVAEGYFAAAMDIPDSADVQKRLHSICRGTEGVVTLCVARAGKKYADDTVSCEIGDYIAVLNDRVVFAAEAPVDAFFGGLSLVEDIDDRETCLIFSGASSTPDWEEALEERLGDVCDALDCRLMPGGQHTYLWIGGII